jgi:putative Holliday junction resolvase
MRTDGPVLGLDLGSRRIGIAISDAAGALAFPAGWLERSSPSGDLAALRALALERGVTRVVVGLPLHMNGSAGPEAEAARAFARELAQATGLDVELLDERWTTREAERSLREAPGRRRRRPGEIDSVAATLILRTYLERARAERARA